MSSAQLASIALVATLVLSCGSSSDGAPAAGDDARAGDDAEGDAASNDSALTDTSTGGGSDTRVDDSAAADVIVADATDATDAPADAALGPYPSPPYGNAVGSTFPALSWEGYVDDAADALASTKPYGPYSSDQLRKSGKRYALVHVAEFF